jgi:aminoglycoside phosphotransferase (APT) family kinase protein
MLRRLHEASRTFTPPPDARWMPWTLHTDGEHALISHGNIAPWHVVFQEGRPTGLIGWEYAGPVDPIDEVAVTAWYCVQLFDDDVAEQIGLPAAQTRAGWFKNFLDGYGLAHTARTDLIDRILRFAIRDNGWYARVQGFTRESTDTEGLWTLAWQSRAALWTLEHRELLTRTAMR